MVQKATPRLLKDLNERSVLETIRSAAPISRAEISRRAGISKPTVSQALGSLLDAGLVREADHDPAGPSYGALFFEAVPDAALVLGLDLGTRFLRGAICDLDGRLRARQDLELGNADVDTALDAIGKLRDSLQRSTDHAGAVLDNAVLGVPGVVDTATGRVSLAANVPGLEQRPFRDEVRERLGMDVALENDINLAALGEQWLGVARGAQDFAFLSIGTGLGCGIVLRGELHRGHNGAAGELDFVRAGFGDQLDPCAGALAELTTQAVSGHAGTTALAPPYDAPAVFAAARQGDELACRVVEEEARRIALHIVPLAAAADLGLVVLGGGLGANGDLLLNPIRRLLGAWLPYPPLVEVSSLGDGAVLSGALAVGLRSALDNVFVNRTRPARATP